MEIAEVLNKASIALKEAGSHYERKTLEELFRLNGKDIKLRDVELPSARVGVRVDNYHDDDWIITVTMRSH